MSESPSTTPSITVSESSSTTPPTTVSTQSSSAAPPTTVSTQSSSTTSSGAPSSTPPCGPQVCFSTKFNSQTVPSGDVIWLSAAFKPKFSGTSGTVSFTNSHITINDVAVSPTPPDSFIMLLSGLQSCSTTQFVNGKWNTTAPLPGSGNTFFSAVSIPVPTGVNWASASVTWCGDVRAPGEVDVQIAAAIYTSCPMDSANPESCETHTNYHAGVPTGCLSKLVPGGTGGGGSNYSGSLSATYAVCKPI